MTSTEIYPKRSLKRSTSNRITENKVSKEWLKIIILAVPEKIISFINLKLAKRSSPSPLHLGEIHTLKPN